LFDFLCVAGGSATSVNTKLLLRILSSLEDVKQTQRSHSMLLHSVMRQGAGSGYTGNEIPDGLDFPLQNVEDVDSTEDKLADKSTRTALVSQSVKSLIICCR